jgi:hypothetical protein
MSPHIDNTHEHNDHVIAALAKRRLLARLAQQQTPFPPGTAMGDCRAGGNLFDG